jgi:outer membrane protein OmpA-like peptidoglycan-associated protein
MKDFTKRLNVFCLLLIVLSILSAGCFTTSKTQRGAAIGGGMGATVGALIGKTAGNTALGTIIGGAIGGTAGAYIGHKMDQVSNLNQTILFGAGSDTLSTDAQANLKKLAVSLQNAPQANVSITGYTDSLGAANYNMDLSVRRAEAVKASLVAAGVAFKRLTTQGKGATQQIATNATHEGREKNRRVVIVVALAKK